MVVGLVATADMAANLLASLDHRCPKLIRGRLCTISINYDFFAHVQLAVFISM